MSEPPIHDVDRLPLSRRALLAGALGIGGLAALETLAWQSVPAYGLQYVQYQFPFPLSTIWQHWHAGGGNHSGTDFSYGGCAGDPIPAVADGVVCHASNNASAARGIRVEISHADGAYSAYCHMSSAAVTVGTSVVRGQTVGYIGNTGYIPDITIGTHLHLGMSGIDLEAMSGSNTFDPIPYIQDRLAASSTASIQEEDSLMGVMYMANIGTSYTTVPSTTSSGTAHPGGVVVATHSLWFQECPGAPLFPLSGGIAYQGSNANVLEYEGWADQRPTVDARRQMGDASHIGQLIQLRGVTQRPIGNFI